MTERKRFYKVPEVARELSIGCTLANKLIRDGDLKSVKMGKCRRVPAEALDEFIAKISGTGN